MKELLLIGLSMAFSVAKKIPAYVPYEDMLEVKQDSWFKPQRYDITEYLNIDTLLECKQMCLKYEHCLWFGYHEKKQLCKFENQEYGTKLQTASAVIQAGTRSSFLHDRSINLFEVSKMGGGGDVIATKYVHPEGVCRNLCYQKALCDAAYYRYHKQSCSASTTDCLAGKVDHYDCFTYDRYGGLQVTDGSTTFVPRLKPIDSCVVVGIRETMIGCDFTFTYYGMPSRQCEQFCIQKSSIPCKVWQSTGSARKCVHCHLFPWSSKTLKFVTSPNNIVGIPQRGRACPRMKGVRITSPSTTYVERTKDQCKKRCKNALGYCKQYSHYGSSCVLSGGSYVTAQIDTTATTEFLYKNVARTEPCVFRGIKLTGGRLVGTSNDRKNFANCWEWCLDVTDCNVVNYNPTTDKCDLHEGHTGIAWAGRKCITSILRDVADGSCGVKGIRFSGTFGLQSTKISPTRTNIQSHDACKQVCKDRSKKHGDCYGFYWNGSDKCEMVGVADDEVVITNPKGWSGHIQF